LKQLNEGQQRAIVTLFDDMARAGLVWEDGGPANIFLRQLKDGRWMAGVVDTDRIARFGQVSSERLGFYLPAPMAGPLVRVNSGVPRTATSAHDYMAKALEYKGWIRYQNGQFVPGRLDPEIVRSKFTLTADVPAR
ncbi:MAG TPA: hypothetical protein VNK41_12340, partial [Vicinamibacterales bacterium]|nr:hypothetical protein [Vicinamibacterales bacterium]